MKGKRVERINAVDIARRVKGSGGWVLPKWLGLVPSCKPYFLEEEFLRG